MTSKWVTVVIPTYGRSVDMVKLAVDSILNQTYTNVDVIIVDDNLKTSPHCKELKDYCSNNKRVSYIKTKGQQGACVARNLGTQQAKGEFIGFLDDDDEWLPTKIEVSLPLFKEDVAMVGSRGWQVTINKEREVLLKEPYMGDLFKKEPTFKEMLRCDSIGTTTLALVHKEKFLNCGGFREDLPARQDYNCWLRILKKYRIVFTNEYLFNYYIHNQEQITKSDQRALDGVKKVYEEFKADFDADKQGYAYINMLMLKRYMGLGDKSNQYKCLMNILKVQPRYLGRYIADTTKNKKLKEFLQKHQKNLAQASNESN